MEPEDQATGPSPSVTFRNMTVFLCRVLLASRPTPKLEDDLLSAVRD
jgi:hypothetical protein